MSTSSPPSLFLPAAVVGCKSGGFKVGLVEAPPTTTIHGHFDERIKRERFFDAVLLRNELFAEVVHRRIDEATQVLRHHWHQSFTHEVMERFWSEAVSVLLLARGASLLMVAPILVILHEHKHAQGAPSDRWSSVASRVALERTVRLVADVACDGRLCAWAAERLLSRPPPRRERLNKEGRIVLVPSSVYGRVWKVMGPLMKVSATTSQPISMPHVWKVFQNRIDATSHNGLWFRALLERFLMHAAALVHRKQLGPAFQDMADAVAEEGAAAAVQVGSSQWDGSVRVVDGTPANRTVFTSFLDYFQARARAGAAGGGTVRAWVDIENMVRKQDGMVLPTNALRVVRALFQKAINTSGSSARHGDDVFVRLRADRCPLYSHAHGQPWLVLATLCEGMPLHRLHVFLAMELVARGLILPAFTGLVLGDVVRSLAEDPQTLWLRPADADAQRGSADRFGLLETCIDHVTEAGGAGGAAAPPHEDGSGHVALHPVGAASTLETVLEGIVGEPEAESLVSVMVRRPFFGIDSMFVMDGLAPEDLHLRRSDGTSMLDAIDHGSSLDEDTLPWQRLAINEHLLGIVRPALRVGARATVVGTMLAAVALHSAPIREDLLWARAWRTLRGTTLEGMMIGFQVAVVHGAVQWLAVPLPSRDMATITTRQLLLSNERTVGSVDMEVGPSVKRKLFRNGRVQWVGAGAAAVAATPLQPAFTPDDGGAGTGAGAGASSVALLLTPVLKGAPRPPSPDGEELVPKVVVAAGTRFREDHQTLYPPVLYPSIQSCSITELEKQKRRVNPVASIHRDRGDKASTAAMPPPPPRSAVIQPLARAFFAVPLRPTAFTFMFPDSLAWVRHWARVLGVHAECTDIALSADAVSEDDMVVAARGRAGTTHEHRAAAVHLCARAREEDAAHMLLMLNAMFVTPTPRDKIQFLMRHLARLPDHMLPLTTARFAAQAAVTPACMHPVREGGLELLTAVRNDAPDTWPSVVADAARALLIALAWMSRVRFAAASDVLPSHAPLALLRVALAGPAVLIAPVASPTAGHRGQDRVSGTRADIPRLPDVCARSTPRTAPVCRCGGSCTCGSDGRIWPRTRTRCAPSCCARRR